MSVALPCLPATRGALRGAWPLAAALLCALLPLQEPAAQAPDPSRDANAGPALSFEQLGSLEVKGVSKALERVLDAPAVVSIISASDIHAYGYRTLADALNSVPGMLTYGDGAYAYLGVRGFAPINSYNSRVLLLIDGFAANDNFYQQALLGSEGVVDLDLVERIEVIRGPSSSVYGSNAFFGVINVVLKSPAQLESGAQVWLGSNAERGLAAQLSSRVARETGADLSYLLRVSTSGERGPSVHFPAQAGLPAGLQVSGVDGNDQSRALAKIMMGNWRLNLGFGERRQEAGFGLYGSVIGDPRSFVRDGLAFADLHYEGNLGTDTDYVLRSSLAQYRFDSDIIDPAPGGSLPNFLPTTGDWIDTEATATHHLSARIRLVLGVQLRRDLRERQTESNPVQGIINEVRQEQNRFGAYAQSDLDWSPQFSSSLGLRADRDNGQSRVNPRLALLWKPDDEQVIKLLYGSAFREASAFEKYFSQGATNLANPRLAAETLRTLDLQYAAQLTPQARLELAAFQYRADQLIAQVILDPLNEISQYQNIDAARTRGVDFQLEQELWTSVRGRLGGSYANARDLDGSWQQNSPHWTGQAGLDGWLAPSWRLAAQGLFAGPRLAIDQSLVPGYGLLNLNLDRRGRPGQADVSLGITNVLNRHYAAPVAGTPINRVDQPGRTWRLTVGIPL